MTDHLFICYSIANYISFVDLLKAGYISFDLGEPGVAHRVHDHV